MDAAERLAQGMTERRPRARREVCAVAATREFLGHPIAFMVFDRAGALGSESVWKAIGQPRATAVAAGLRPRTRVVPLQETQHDAPRIARRGAVDRHLDRAGVCPKLPVEPLVTPEWALIHGKKY